MARYILLVPVLIFFGLAAMMFIGLQRDDPNQLPSALEGRMAPAAVVTPLGDKPVLSDAMLRDGGVKLVNFWASWCAPCRVEHPQLEALAAEGVTIYGVNYKDKAPNALKFLTDLGDPYAAIGSDAEGRMALDWGVYGVPETYVIDGNGTIVLRHAGPITKRIIEEAIRPAIAKAASN